MGDASVNQASVKCECQPQPQSQPQSASQSIADSNSNSNSNNSLVCDTQTELESEFKQSNANIDDVTSNRLAVSSNCYSRAVIDKRADISQDEQHEEPQQPTTNQPTSNSNSNSNSSNTTTTNHDPEELSISLGSSRGRRTSGSTATSGRLLARRFRKLDESELSQAPAPDVKIGQRVAYREYYGSEFGTIRWIGRVPQVSRDWTVGVEFDNAIGEGDGSLNGRRYFIAKDCFAKFLPLDSVAIVEQHVGRPEPGTMISVMSAAVRPGQLISVQRVSTVHVEHCFLNAPHQLPGAELLGVNRRLHCQCPNCGPCAHVVKPPRTQSLARPSKNATHMCQFSTYTCCGMQGHDETLCAYSGGKPHDHAQLGELDRRSAPAAATPTMGLSWIAGAGYLSQLQAHQAARLPADELRWPPPGAARRASKSSSRRSSTKASQPGAAEGAQVRERASSVRNRNRSQQVQLPAEPRPEVDEPRARQLPGGDESEAEAENGNAQLQAEPQPQHKQQPSISNHSAILLESQEPDFELDQDLELRRLLGADGAPLDSSIEADLEKLSQARYGHHNHAHSHHGRHKRSRGVRAPARGLVGTLGKLVRCLRLAPNQRTAWARRNPSNSPVNSTSGSWPLPADASPPPVDFRATTLAPLWGVQNSSRSVPGCMNADWLASQQPAFAEQPEQSSPVVTHNNYNTFDPNNYNYNYSCNDYNSYTYTYNNSSNNINPNPAIKQSCSLDDVATNFFSPASGQPLGPNPLQHHSSSGFASLSSQDSSSIQTEIYHRIASRLLGAKSRPSSDPSTRCQLDKLRELVFESGCPDDDTRGHAELPEATLDGLIAKLIIEADQDSLNGNTLDLELDSRPVSIEEELQQPDLQQSSPLR